MATLIRDHRIISTSGGAIGGTGIILQSLLYWLDATGDNDPTNGYILAASASTIATTAANKIGGDLRIASGIGSTLVTMVSIAAGDVNIGVTVNGDGAVSCRGGIAGLDWLFGANTTEAASNLAQFINLHATLGAQVTASRVGLNVHLQPKESCYYLSITTSLVGAATVTMAAPGTMGVYGNVRLGKPGTPGSATANGDVYVAGALEIDGAVYIHNGASITSNIWMSSGSFNMGAGFGFRTDAAGTTGGFYPSLTAQTPDIPALTTGTYANGVLICENADIGYDWAPNGGVAYTDPTLVIMGKTQQANSGLALSYNDVAGVLATRAGNINLSPAAGSSVVVPDGTAAAPGLRTTTEAHGVYRYDATHVGLGAAGVFSAYFGTDNAYIVGNIIAAAVKNIGWSGRSTLSSSGDGYVKAQNNASTAGVLFDFTTDSVLSLRNRGDTLSGAFNADYFNTKGPTTDVAPNASLRRGASALASASAGANRIGGDVKLVGGLGSRFYTALINSHANIVVTTTINGTSVVLTGSNPIGANQFALGTDDTAPQLAVTATNLAAALNLNATFTANAVATSAAAVVYIQPKHTVYELALSTDDGTHMSSTISTDGNIVIPTSQILASDDSDMMMGAPAYSFDGDPDCGMYHYSPNEIGFGCNSTVAFRVTEARAYGPSNIAFAEGILATATAVDLSNAAKVTLYTVPAGKTCIVTKIVVRSPSADISAATFGFGGDANATDWMAAQDLTGLTAADDALMLHPAAGVAFKAYAAAATFGLKPTVAEGAADTVTIDVFGYLV